MDHDQTCEDGPQNLERDAACHGRSENHTISKQMFQSAHEAPMPFRKATLGVDGGHARRSADRDSPMNPIV